MGIIEDTLEFKVLQIEVPELLILFWIFWAVLALGVPRMVADTLLALAVQLLKLNAEIWAFVELEELIV